MLMLRLAWELTTPTTRSGPILRLISERMIPCKFVPPRSDKAFSFLLYCSVWRSWFWTICNEFGWFQTGAPSGPTLVSRLVRPICSERQCTLMFKDAFTQPPVPNTDRTNSKYQGWNVKADRL